MPEDLVEVVHTYIDFIYSLSQAAIISEIVGTGTYNNLSSCYVNSAKCKSNSFSPNKHQTYSVRWFSVNLKKDFSKLV